MSIRTGLTGLVAGCALLSTASSHAFLSFSGGNTAITFSSYSSGTLYGLPPVGSICATEAACDLAGLPATGSFGDDSFAVFTVDTITDAGAIFPPLYGGGSANPPPFLVGVFYGLRDHDVERTAGGFEVESIGGTIEIYELSLPAISGLFPYDATDRTGLTTFPGITDTGSLWLSADFAAGTLAALDSQYSAATTYRVNFNDLIVGDGLGFLDVTGGSAAGRFDTDQEGVGNDLIFGVEIGPNGTSNGFDTFGAGTAQGFVPVPGTLGLLGVAMLALGSVRRRSARAA